MSQELVDKFITHLRVERGLSPNTQVSYRLQLGVYLRFLKNKGRDVGSAQRDDILEYLERRKNGGLRASSLYIVTMAIRQFHRLLKERSLAYDDPTFGIRLPKFKQRLPEPLSTADMDKLLQPILSGKFTSVRNLALVEVAFSTGLRAFELITLKMNQVNLTEGWVRIIGKGNRERVVPFGKKAKEALLGYLKVRANRFPMATDTIFLNSRGQPLTRGGFWWQLKRMARQKGVTGRVTPHQLRHSFATKLLEGGADIRIISSAMGHQSISQTQKYAHVSPALILKSCQKAHPRF